MALTKTPIELSSTQGIVDNSNATAITIDSSENVGIGVSPSAPLDVRRGDADGKIAEFHQSGGYGLELSSSQSVATITAGYNQAFTFETGTTATERMRIDASGNVDLYQGKNLTWRYAAGSTIRGSISVDSADNITFSNTSSNTERMRIDTSGNLLVGTTATTINTSSSVSGHNLFSSGYTVHSRSGQTVMSLNRLSTDGTIVDFRKDGTAVGSIGTVSGDIRIGGLDDNHAAIRFAASSKAVLPVKNSDGDLSDNTTDLGASSARFKDLYLSGNALVGRTSSLSSQSGSVSANTVVSAHGPLSSHTTSAGILEHYNDETLLRSYGANAGSGKLVFKVGGGGGSADSEAMRIDSSGNVTKPYQPAFSVTVNAAQNNLAVGADVTIVFGDEVFDVGANFANNTFTAPVTGKYQLNLILRLNNVDSASPYYIVSFFSSNRNYRFIYDSTVFAADADYWAASLSVLADMDANDTVYVTVNQGGGAAQTDVDGNGSYQSFSGYLAC